MKPVLFSAIFLLAMAVNAFGQSPALTTTVPDTTRQIVILFPFNKSVIDSSFMGNSENLNALHDIMSDRTFMSGLDSVVVTATASPDGASWYNKLLAQRRANSIKDYITGNYPYVKPSIVTARASRRYWEGLIELAEQDPCIPDKEEFLEMLRDPKLSDDEKNQIMNTMSEGRVFVYIRDNFILRQLRQGSVSIMLYPPHMPETQPVPEPQAEIQPVQEPELIPSSLPEPVAEIPVVTPRQRKTVLALRTNLLLDIIGGPNLGLEVPIGRRFSVAGDFVYAHTRINNRIALQTIQGTLEARHWFNPRRNVLTGWNLGVYGTYCSRFDVQWGSGFQGDGYWSGGLTAGYSVPLSNRFNLDFSLAGGYFYSPEIRRYSRPRDGHLIWEKTMYNVSRITLTQVRVNLVWLINNRAK